MDARVPGALLFFLLISLLSFVSADGDCMKACRTPISADWTGGELQQSCGQNNVTYVNKYCPMTLATINVCLYANIITGIQYAGPCGCPNNCFVDSNQGFCAQSFCQCNRGWKGPDCSQVDCSESNTNDCNFQGICTEDDTCLCNSSWTGADCSTEVIKPLNVPQVVPSTQYSSEDDFGNQHPIFDTSVIAQINLVMNPEDLQFLLNPINEDNSVYKKATMSFDNGRTSKKMDAVGIRIKGNSSRSYGKKSFKISFTEFDDDNEWDQIKKISLKGFQTDPSYLRDAMATNVAFSMNAYIQRFGWVQLTINDQSYGFYYLGEEVNKQYLDSRFGTNDGPLYKCTAPLTWKGPNVETYANYSCGDHLCYDPKTNEAEDFTELRNFLAVLNITSNNEFAQEVVNVLDVDLFLRTFAFEVATGNWDGLRDSNNYYLFKNPTDGLWKYIRHDNDNAFGELPEYVRVVTNDIYTWADGEQFYNPGRFLYNRMMAIPDFKLTYSNYLNALLDGFYGFEGPSHFRSISRSYETLCSVPVLRDVPHYLDTGYTYRTFNNSFYTTLEKPETLLFRGQIILSFFDFMSERKVSAKVQLNNFFNSL